MQGQHRKSRTLTPPWPQIPMAKHLKNSCAKSAETCECEEALSSCVRGEGRAPKQSTTWGATTHVKDLHAIEVEDDGGNVAGEPVVLQFEVSATERQR